MVRLSQSQDRLQTIGMTWQSRAYRDVFKNLPNFGCIYTVASINLYWAEYRWFGVPSCSRIVPWNLDQQVFVLRVLVDKPGATSRNRVRSTQFNRQRHTNTHMLKSDNALAGGWRISS